MTDSPTNPLRKFNLPLVGKVLAFLLLVVLVIVGGWKGFRAAKLRLSLARAHHEFTGKQIMRAEFWAGQALDVDAKNVDATRLMAEINEVEDKPAALGWRIKAAQLSPGNTADILAWAKTAFRFGQGDMAVNALESLPPDFKKQSADYHEMMAGVALASHENGLAEAYFVKASELGGANPLHQVNLAAFRLANSPSREVRAAAAQELEGAVADPRAGLFALRALLTDAIRNRDSAKAQPLAERLRSFPAHTLSDDLRCLEATPSEAAFRAALEPIERRAESQAAWTSQVGDWLNAHDMAAETLRWYPRLPDADQANARVQITVAESYLALRDWNGLETFLNGCHWEGAEFLRKAMLIRSKRERSQPWEKEWKQLTEQAGANPPEGYLLAQLVIGWKWRTEAINLLWSAASSPKSDSKALQLLWEIYAQANETRELLRVAKAQIALDPSNPARKNNTAFLTLLLFGPSERSETLAREASTSHPNIPEWAATYAFALHLSGKESAAKKVMEALPPEALARPGIALYYAIVLAGNGEDDRARESLAKLNANGMLPEERKLAADLAQKLNVASH